MLRSLVLAVAGLILLPLCLSSAPAHAKGRSVLRTYGPGIVGERLKILRTPGPRRAFEVGHMVVEKSALVGVGAANLAAAAMNPLAYNPITGPLVWGRAAKNVAGFARAGMLWNAWRLGLK